MPKHPRRFRWPIGSGSRRATVVLAVLAASGVAAWFAQRVQPEVMTHDGAERAPPGKAYWVGQHALDAFAPCEPPSAASALPEPTSSGARGTEKTVYVRVFRGPDVSDAFVRAQLGFATDFFSRYHIRVALEDEPVAIPMTDALAEKADGLLKDTTSELSDDMWRALLAPILAFIASHGIPPERERVLVVFLPRIAPIRSPLRGILPHLTGLTLERASRSRQGSGSALPIARLLGGRPWTPTIVVSSYDVGQLPAPRLPSALAHEMGHAFGLVHSEASGNLMAPSPHPCVPFLTSAQRSLMRVGP